MLPSPTLGALRHHCGLLVAAAFLSLAGCGGDAATGPGSVRSLRLDRPSAQAFEVVTATISGGRIADSLPTVQWDSVRVRGVRRSDSTLAVMLPALAAGPVTVTFENGNRSYAATLQVVAPAAATAPELLVEPALDDALALMDSLTAALDPAAVGADSSLLAGIRVGVLSARAQFAAATPQERQQVAAILRANAEVLGLASASSLRMLAHDAPSSLEQGARPYCRSAEDVPVYSLEECEALLAQDILRRKAAFEKAVAVIAAAGAAAAGTSGLGIVAAGIAVGIIAPKLMATVQGTWERFVVPQFEVVEGWFDAEPATLRAEWAAAVARREFTNGQAAPVGLRVRYRSPIAADAATNPGIAVAVAVVEYMRGAWNAVAEWIPGLDPLPALPTTRRTVVAAAPARYVQVTGVAPSSIAASAVARDSALSVTFTLAGQGKDLPFAFSLRYAPPSGAPSATTVEALLKPTSYAVASVTVAPDSVATFVGRSAQLGVVLRDSSGALLEGRTVTWTSSNGARAMVNASGLVTAFDTGTVTITASVGSVSGSARVSIGSTPPSVVKAVAAGNLRSCIIAMDDRAYCWGSNLYGALGIGSDTALTAPSVPVGNGMRFSRIATGQYHSCGITTDGDAYCWGLNDYGRLGTGNTTSSSSPMAVAGGLKFREIVTGSFHTCAMTQEGQVYCWGYATNAGVSEAFEHRLTPVAVGTTERFTSLVGGQVHTCGLTAGGTAFCWGGNSWGELGVGDASSRISTPQQAQGGPWKTLVAGRSFTCGITSADVTVCWGANYAGQLGGGTVGGSSFTPVTVAGGHTFVALTAEEGDACGLKADGSAYCWGNRVTEIDFNPQPSGTPTRVQSPVAFGFIDLGVRRYCALTPESALYCWSSQTTGPAQPQALP